MTLVRLLLNLGLKHIAQLFKITPQDASALFRDWVNFMHFTFAELPAHSQPFQTYVFWCKTMAANFN